VGLIDIPPYVRAGEDPPSATTEVRAYHCRTYELVDPIDFPRAPFESALAEHARLLDSHSAEILAAPLDHIGKPADDRFVELENLHFCSTVLVGDGAAHEVHKWRTVDLSFVVWRCRGIVRQLMEVPPEGHTYVVVVAQGVASLQLCRGVPPRRVGEGPRLEVVERDLVVEPWDQWHLRAGHFVKTWWRTPLGELVASRVRVRRWPHQARPVTDDLLMIRGPSLRKRIDAYVREHPGHKPLAVLDVSLIGEEIDVDDRRERDPRLEDFPGIVEALRVARTGLDPVVVYAYRWASLCWLPAAGTSDVAVPEPLVVERKPQPDDDVHDDEEDAEDEDEGAKKKPEPRIRLSKDAHFAALFDDFPPIDPWAPRTREVNAAWIAGLVLAVYAVLLVIAAGELWYRWTDLYTDRLLGIAAVVLAACGTFLAVPYFRWHLRQLDPARRRDRWRAWKQVQDELKPRTKPKPKAPGRKFWMRKLAQRLSRLERLVGLDAPEIIIDNERRMVRDAIAELPKSDADAVLAAWPTAVRHLEPPEVRREASKQGRGTDKPN
jgi:hypothetical protein